MEEFIFDDPFEKEIANEQAFEHHGVSFDDLTDLVAKREYYEIAKEVWEEANS